MRKVIFGVVALAVLAAYGCKPKAKGTASDLTTLENFALNNDVRINACTAPLEELEKKDPRSKVASFIEVADTAKAKLISAELILALSAVPEAALKIFQAQNGKIFITEDAPRYCSFAGALRFNGKTPIFQSCMVDIPYGSGKTPMQKGLEGKTLVSIPDAKAIRHGIVRTMGYMLAEALEQDPGFSKLKVELTKSFLTDVAKSSVFKLEAQEGLLGKGIDGVVRKNIAAKADNLLAGSSATKGAVFNFMNYVMGEAFDSYFCRTGKGAFFEEKTANRIKKPEDAPLFAYLTDTRLVMKHFFPRTYASFLLVDAHMRGYANTLPTVNFRGAKGGASLTSDEAPASFGLQDGDVSVGQRKVQLEQQIREHANNTRFAYEQWQQKKSTYDGSWTDVWGTKKSEMDLARAVYRGTTSREQALLSELRAVEAEEAKVGAAAKTENNRQFSNQNLKVDTFDANKELAKAVQDTAKGYGQATSKYAGAAGQYVGGETGKAFGEGLGDGVGGVLGAFGKNTTDAIEGVQNKVSDAGKFANDLAIDPTGTLYKAGAEKLKETGETFGEIGSLGKEVWNGDRKAILNRGDKLLNAVPGVNTLYNTTQNTYAFATAKNSAEAQAAIDRQYVTAGRSISDVQDALIAKAGDAMMESGPIGRMKDQARTQVIGGINNWKNDLILHPPGTSEFSKLRGTVEGVRKIEKAYEYAEHAKTGLEYLKETAASPAGGLEGLQQQVPGHSGSGVAPFNTQRPIPSPTETSLFNSPGMVSSAPSLPVAPQVSAAPAPVSSGSSSSGSSGGSSSSGGGGGFD